MGLLFPLISKSKALVLVEYVKVIMFLSAFECNQAFLVRLSEYYIQY